MADRNTNLLRRSTDKRFVVVENWYRDIWMLVLSGVLVLALWTQVNTTRDFRANIQNGRRFATTFTCYALSALSQAGYEVILRSSGGSDNTPFMHKLEALGYPPLVIRKKNAEKAAQLYVDTIIDSVSRGTGIRGRSLIYRNGSINCRQFGIQARTKFPK